MQQVGVGIQHSRRCGDGAGFGDQTQLELNPDRHGHPVEVAVFLAEVDDGAEIRSGNLYSTGKNIRVV